MRCDSAALRRDLPIPGSPETSTTCPLPAFACCQRLSRRSSSSSRPTSGVASERSASKRLNTPLSPTIRQARCASENPASACWPRSSISNRAPICRRVLSAMTSVSGAASPCSRAARFSVSPTTPRSCAAPVPIKSPTTTRPLAMPSPFIGRSPDTATAEDLRLFQLHQTQIGMQPPSINSAVSALRFFFTVTLDRPDLARRLTVVPYPRRIPAVLSVEEVTLLLRAATAPKYKAAFATAYGAGLRVSEVVALKVGDIDSERMLLRVERGKGRKDRHAMLSPQLLDLLRAWWREGRRRSLLLPGGWLFPGRNPVEPLSARQLCRAVRAAAQAAGIKKRVSPHTLRHSFATHLLEQDVDIRVIQTLLGHAKLDTTALYTRVANTTIRAVTSPLDRLAPSIDGRPRPGT